MMMMIKMMMMIYVIHKQSSGRHTKGGENEIHWNLIITLMLGSIRNQCYIRIVL